MNIKEKSWIKRLIKWIYDNPLYTYAIIIIAGAVFVLSYHSIEISIKNSENQFDVVEASGEKPFELISDPQRIGSYKLQIIKDKETNVEYIIVYCRDENAITITPRLKGDSDEQYTEQ